MTSIAAIVVGVSAGGLEALSQLLPALPADFPCPLAIVQHRANEPDDGFLAARLNSLSQLRVLAAEEKCTLESATAYLAPPGYHLLIERDHTFSLSVDPPVHHSRPSIDVLFESALLIEDALQGAAGHEDGVLEDEAGRQVEARCR